MLHKVKAYHYPPLRQALTVLLKLAPNLQAQAIFSPQPPQGLGLHYRAQVKPVILKITVYKTPTLANVHKMISYQSVNSGIPNYPMGPIWEENEYV